MTRSSGDDDWRIIRNKSALVKSRDSYDFRRTDQSRARACAMNFAARRDRSTRSLASHVFYAVYARLAHIHIYTCCIRIGSYRYRWTTYVRKGQQTAEFHRNTIPRETYGLTARVKHRSCRINACNVLCYNIITYYIICARVCVVGKTFWGCDRATMMMIIIITLKRYKKVIIIVAVRSECICIIV